MSDLPPEYLEYMERRLRDDAARVQVALDTLTPFERRLLHEAAVMGAAVGTMYGHNVRLPKNHLIVRDVVSRCIANDQAFPLLAHLAEGTRPAVTEEGGHIPGGPA